MLDELERIILQIAYDEIDKRLLERRVSGRAIWEQIFARFPDIAPTNMHRLKRLVSQGLLEKDTIHSTSKITYYLPTTAGRTMVNELQAVAK